MTTLGNAWSEVDVQTDWIRFDFSNSAQFEGTVPVYCSVGGRRLEGKSWSHILVGIVEQEISKNNSALEPLYERSIFAKQNSRPFFLKNKLEGLNCTELSNGYWLNVNYNIPRILDQIQTLCLLCGYNRNDVLFFGVPRNGVNRKDAMSHRGTGNSGNGINPEKTEEYLLSRRLTGATVQEIIDAVQPNASASPTRNMLDSLLNVISMPDDRYVHTDAFVDLDEAEEGMQRILQTHFKQFSGYSNSKLLFVAASNDLSMFLNDNDCQNVNSVYSLCRYFFSKKKTRASYAFSSPHIFEKTPDFPLTQRGLTIHLARANGGVLHIDSIQNYFKKASLSCHGVAHILQLASSDSFLHYDEDRVLLTEKVGVNEVFKRTLYEKLDGLFREADVAYVIPRDITEAWLHMLPTLPLGLPWTPLLLQEVLRNYPDIGFRSITSGVNQFANTIAAAFVPVDSFLQSFPDVVTLYMQEKYTLPKRMTCEELRQELRNAGMLKGNELFFTLPKALDDFRFSWTDENKTVLVRGA